MGDTFSQLYIQIVFGVRNRKKLIHASWEEQLFKFIAGIIKNKGQKLLSINGMPDHIHILIGMKASCNLSDLVREIKKSTNTFINDNRFCKNRFYWQKGFGAFSYSKQDIGNVIGYIQRQKEHHAGNIDFLDEYVAFLKEYEIDFEMKYL
jgi:REP element-mobilizing transposase RayT